MKQKLGIIFIILVFGFCIFLFWRDGKEEKSDHTIISWNDDGLSATGDGVNYDQVCATIYNGGTYELTGTTSNGNVIIDAKESDVTLILNSLHLTSTTTAPIYVKKAKSVTLIVQEDTKNELVDSDTYQETDQDEIQAVIHSKSDLYIEGKGILQIKANYNNGITGKDSVSIQESTIHIDSKNNGIRVKDALKTENATIKIEALGNGIRAYNETDSNSGTIELVRSDISIQSTQDGVEAISSLVIDDGIYQIITGGGSSNTSTKNDWGSWGEVQNTESTSAKGLKSDHHIFIKKGTISIDSSDDSIHCNHTVSVQGGVVTLSSGDDGIHADDTLSIENGEIEIQKSYEGLEASNINLKGGTVHIHATDDGINAAGGADGSSLDRRGANMFASDGSKIIIDGGYYVIDSGGDGIDSNGDIEMNDGTVIIEGPTDDGNGALDYNGTYNIHGGTLIAVGSSGMAEAPSNSSTQNSIQIAFSGQDPNSVIQITDENQKSILTFSPSKQYSSLVYSSASLVSNSKYTIQLGGTSTGKSTDGLIQNGEYQNGSTLTTLTLKNAVTSYGNFQMVGGMPPRR